MKYFPEASTVKDILKIEGLDAADTLLQNSMKNAAETAARTQLESLQGKENHHLTSHGMKWISQHLQTTADYIFCSAEGLIKSFLNFPKKYKGISAEDYYMNKSDYSLKYKKNANTAEELRVNKFIEDSGLAMSRARTVALIALTAVIREVMTNRKEAHRGRAMTDIQRNILHQLSIYYYKAAKTERVVIEPKHQFFDNMSQSLENKICRIFNTTKKALTNNDQLKQCLNIIHFISELSEDISLQTKTVGRLSKVFIVASDKLLNDADSMNQNIIASSTMYRPVIQQPKAHNTYNSYREGLKSRIVNSNKITVLPDALVEVVHRLQSTAFRINPSVLKFLKYVKQEDFIFKKFNLEVPDHLDPKSRPDKEDKEAYKKWQQLDDKTESAIKEAVSINRMAGDAIETAEYYQQLDTPFYCPCYLDYRGRMYYLTNGINPQASKAIKAMFMAAEPELVGENFETKFDFFKLALSGCLSNVSFFSGTEFKSTDGDKAPWQVRLKWVSDRLDFFQDIAENPHNHIDFLQAQEDPYGLIAYCSELKGWIIDREQHKTSVFIQFDGSTNAYQHSAAYLLDRQTGECVNITGRPKTQEPSDMYGLVATEFNRLIPKSELKYREEFIATKISTRKSCKRIVMTMAYGLTEGGAFRYGQQEVNEFTKVVDGVVTSPFSDTDEAANEFSKTVLASIDTVTPAVRRVKEAIQLMAEMCADLRVEKRLRDSTVIRTGVPFTFTTGLGLKVSYNKTTEVKKTVNMMIRGQRKTFVLKEKSEYSDRQQLANSSSPNYTHSRDAEHLQRTVLKMSEGTPFLCIHDSFGTLGSRIDELFTAIRTTFVDQYSHSDPLKQLFEESLQPVFDYYSEYFERYGVRSTAHCSDLEYLKPCLDLFMSEKGWSYFDNKFTRKKGGELKKNWSQKERDFEKVIKKMTAIRELSSRTGDLDLNEVNESPYFFI